MYRLFKTHNIRKSYEVDAKTIKFFAKALGYNADSDKQIENSA